MLDKKLLLPILFLTLLLTLAPLTSASFAYSFTYTKFNTTTYTYQATDQNRTAWQAKVVNELVYNTTTAGTATIRFSTATTGNYSRIDLTYRCDGNVDVWIGNESSADKIATSPWTSGETIYYTLDSNGYLNIGNETDRDCILDDYILGSFALNYVGAAGAADTATSGYISVEVDDPPVSMELGITLDIIFAIIPLIFTVSVIGVVIKMFKEVSK